MEINKFIEGNKAFRDIVSSFGSSFSNGRHSSEHTKRRKSSFIPSKIMDYHYRSSISIHYRSSLSSSLTSK
ncbi:hypothetical protein BCR32DRAFT_328140 [Anaeromyces robustus]|uniref:Uncharacterized protein n=1 Tax=Anaeromyces robustus TaxID=1754192 RepID=A0A1Y1X1F4_9FUNG|nr:hypothetical protein BCR32DRAFT_328140 [Anaeromyces robustus]|eukprot:ORX79448.1 hypothetical protein BCR32DRAFT_328140 [Anaeromyces robustus]